MVGNRSYIPANIRFKSWTPYSIYHMNFREWHGEQEAKIKVIDDAINDALQGEPEQSSTVDNQAYDHFYSVKIKLDDKWTEIKELLKKQLTNIGDNPHFKLYPSGIQIQYDGIHNGEMVFNILGTLNRQVNDKPDWMPPQGVFAPHQTAQGRMTFDG